MIRYLLIFWMGSVCCGQICLTEGLNICISYDLSLTMKICVILIIIVTIKIVLYLHSFLE